MSDLQTVEAPRSAKTSQKIKSQTDGTSVRSSQKDWTIKGLPVDSVEIARDAARNSGMKINAWVAQVFADAARGEIPHRVSGDQLHFGVPFDLDEEVRKLRIQNDELLQTISNLSAAIAKMCK